MDKDWKERILTLRHRDTRAGDEEFVYLVDQARGRCSPEVIDVLLRTFTNEPDYGVIESVVSVLASAEQQAYYRVLLEHLPRLRHEAPDHAIDLVEGAMRFHLDELVAVANAMDWPTRAGLLGFIAQPELARSFPNAAEVASKIASEEV